MTLHFYFARKFLFTWLGILAAFATFMWLVDLVEHIRRFDGESVSFTTLAYLTLLHLPITLYEVLTLVVLLATVTLFITLARTSELVVTRAAGRSAIRSVLSPLFTAALIGGLVVAVGNPVVASLSIRYDTETNRIHGSERVISVGRDGLWLRQGSNDRQTAIHAERANSDGTELSTVTFYGFEGNGKPTYRANAVRAILTDGAWRLEDVKRWDLAIQNPEEMAESLDSLDIPSELTRDQIRDSFARPEAIPIWELPAFIGHLEQAGFSARLHRVWFQSELARPLLFAAMVFIGAVFTLRHTRFGRTGLMVLAAVGSGFAVYFVSRLAATMAETGQIPIFIAVWGPPVACICLALSLLLQFEDG
ncbi:LPS export ABC transporter permease LptG [Qingshengfaniella alkalisoli]|uniref:LPS export ABC transporter permease LptG n=1 Tax=Qingshengfaniella alkalisoli TaxID=2599296 RepID=A0A5B8I5Q3_9RHOB|nr:LPS export ABC transporter permease LptG [Qingshengfaniella alkalisoli]QDY68709.1 LPS export ABC transporter permease LptG [Qingshengfaniella alkalisoli]